MWDSATGDPRHQQAFHTAPVLDLDWAPGGSHDAPAFATSSTDKLVLVCTVGASAPARSFVGHTDEVNTVRWAPRGALLASGSDDSTVRLWSVGGDGAPPPGAVATLAGHKKAVYALRWAPTGEGTANAGKAPMLARCAGGKGGRGSSSCSAPPPNLFPTLTPCSASLDHTARVWDPTSGRSRLTLGAGVHSGMLYALAWSPCGEWIATAAADRLVAVWSAQDGALVRTFTGPAAAFDVAFAPEGGRLAATFATGTVAVIDMRK